jgi:hypothetical protein
MKAVLLLILVSSCAAFLSEADSTEAHTAAQRTIDELLLQGKDDGDCRKLATSTITEIRNNVKVTETTYNAIDKGYTCKTAGQPAVTAAKKSKKAAEKKYADAKRTYATACSAKVKFAPKRFDSLKRGQCSTFFDDPVFTVAAKKCTSATYTRSKANGMVKITGQAVRDAETSAAKEKRKCFCKVQKENKEGMKSIRAINSAENAKAWVKAHHMLCVLDNKSPARCSVPKVPKATPKPLAPGAKREKC